MSNLSELLPAGAGAKSASFVASGTLASGQTVALKSDGTVAGIQEQIGSATVFDANGGSYTGCAFDSANNKIVISYMDDGNSYYGTAVVGTVSGNTISFGTPVVYESAMSFYNSCAYDSSNGKIVIAYMDNGNSNYGTAIVGTVSGTAISFGTAAVFESARSDWPVAVYDSNTAKIFIGYEDDGNSSIVSGVVGTVSGTSISFGTPVALSGHTTNVRIGTAYDSNAQKVVMAYRNISNLTYGTAVVGTISGTTVSFGSPTVFEAAATDDISIGYDSDAQKVVISYQDEGNSNYGTAIVGTVSGTSISFGTPVVFFSGGVDETTTVYDPNAQKIVITFADQTSSNHRYYVTGAISGTSISLNTPTLMFGLGSSFYAASVYDSNALRIVTSYNDSTNASGYASVLNTGAATSDSFIGITDAAIADTATGAVIVQGGVSSKLSGLTVGADYYVQDDGSLGSPTVSAPYVIVGATYVQNFSVASQDTGPEGLAFNTDGTKMFVVGLTNDNVYEYTLSTGFDVSTASYSQNFSVAPQEIVPLDIAFNTDGTKMFIVGTSGDDVNEYALSTGFDVSTASFTDAFSVAAQQAAPTAIAFNTDGTKMFVLGTTGADVNEYALGTGFDVSTSTFVAVFSVVAQDTIPVGLAFNTDGTKMFVVGEAGQDVNQYSTGGGSVTSAPAGRALSTTSILLEG